jgi:hypothetical protein
LDFVQNEFLDAAVSRTAWCRNSVSEVRDQQEEMHARAPSLDDRRERRSIAAQHSVVAWEISASAVR